MEYAQERSAGDVSVKKHTLVQDPIEHARAAWRSGELGEATRVLEKVLARNPNQAEALHLTGVVALSAGQPVQAVAFLEKAVHLQPRSPDCWCDLGTALHATGQLKLSEQAYRQALVLKSDHPDGLFNLANVLRERKQLQEALLLYAKLLEFKPSYAEGWNNTGLALLDLQRKQEARRCFETAHKLDPDNVLVLLNLGSMQKDSGALSDAVATYRGAIERKPGYCDLHVNLGTALNALGKTDEAIAALHRAIEVAPGNATAHSSLIFTLDYDAKSTTSQQQQARRRWYEQCVLPLGIRPLNVYTKPEPSKKVRVGYVSADFGRTSAAMCFAPMILHHDRQAFDVVCYSNSVVEDDVTARIRSSVTSFRNIAGLTDEEAARVILADGVDILVDLSGHMRGHRLNIFAFRPAPVQVTAWGYANGTGMPEMDYILTDARYLPDADMQCFSEQRAEAPAVIPSFAFEALPEIQPRSDAVAGAVAFGCFSRLQKVTEASIGLWARILKAVPSSRLLLKSSTQVGAEVLARTRGEFERVGIDSSRVEVLPHTSWFAHMASHARIDLQLDPIPHGGGVSLLEGIAMGVPAVVLEGGTPAGRLGASLLRAIGLDRDWIASTEQEYVALAVRRAANLDSSVAARMALRERLLGSAVGDAQHYVKVVEQTYRAIWSTACEQLRAKRGQWIERAKAALSVNEGHGVKGLLEPLVNADNEDTQALELAGAAAYQLRNYPLALELLQRAVTLPGASSDASINLGIVLTVLQKYGQAIATLREVCERDPRNIEAHYNLGCVLVEQGHRTEALQAFQSALGFDPKRAKVLNNIGAIHNLNADTVLARQFFEAALEAEPGYALSHANLGRLWAAQGKNAQAIEHYERALELDGRLYWVRWELAVAYERGGMAHRLNGVAKMPFKRVHQVPRQQRRGAGARHALMAIARLIQTDMAAQGYGKAQIEDELLKQAGRLMELDHAGKIDVLREVIAFNPDNLHAHLQLGVAHHHDEHCELASRAWAQGLRQRDALAQAAGLADHPHRVLDTSWYMAVGHIQMLDIYLKSVALGNQPERKLWLLRMKSKRIANPHYLGYWRPWFKEAPMDEHESNLDGTARAIGVKPAQLPLVTDHFFSVRESKERELWHMEFACNVQRQWEAERRPCLIALSEEDRGFGETNLRTLGIPAGAWYVCLHVREPGFWWQWDKNHPSIRNAHIASYRRAIEAITGRGGWVVRMGDKTMQPLEAMPGVVDYAHSQYKSERMDVFLCASCRFFIGVNSGISLIPPTFGVPCLLTNFAPISIPFPYGKDRMLPKLFRSKRDGRLLRFDEMFKHRVAYSQFAKNVPAWADVVDNAPEDIADAAIEMMDECTGRLGAQEQCEFAKLRGQYDQVLVSNNSFTGSPVGGRFLRRYADLLAPGRK